MPIFRRRDIAEHRRFPDIDITLEKYNLLTSENWPVGGNLKKVSRNSYFKYKHMSYFLINRFINTSSDLIV